MCHIWLFAAGWCNLQQAALNSKIAALKINNSRTKQLLNFGAKLVTRAIINTRKSLAELWLSDNVFAVLSCVFLLLLVVFIFNRLQTTQTKSKFRANYFVYSCKWYLAIPFQCKFGVGRVFSIHYLHRYQYKLPSHHSYNGVSINSQHL